ncbi:MAG: threonine--tRNA ligase [Candidatus Omnitrophica bacterium]|nr:threonine--tRNA ligase [Candidatus Omnitrophota bacterium]
MDYSRDIDKLRHSCAHVMAQAVKQIWPDVKVAIGPAIENGFYYDFDKKEPFSDQDLAQITKAMQKIINRNLPLTQSFMDKNQAAELFRKQGEIYKVDLIAGISDEKVSIFTTGDNEFADLCKGPHVATTGEIKAFKLQSVAGAYWRGDEKNAMLQRIYGTAFLSKEEQDKYFKLLEEAERRDHRKIGSDLDLFHIYQEEAGAGLVFYHPNGALMRKILEDFTKELHLKRGYQLVITPNFLRGKLWEISGHSGYYRENMYYFNLDGEDYAIKPMNCPGHMLIYKSKLHSYREFPIKYFELGTVYRYEKAGVLHGLLRVRGFTQDDAHIFCRRDQVQVEVEKVLDLAFELLSAFGFKDYEIELSTRPEKFIGKEEDWDLATESLKKALEKKGISYQVNEGDGAFYGPKIDLKLKDALGRKWQCSTVQCDFALPERFDLTFMNEKGEAERPIMLHRALFGSVERFFGTLIEHHAGNFPLWLCPVQVVVIPIRPEHDAFAKEILEKLTAEGLRAEMDARNESLGKRIRENRLQRVPYMLVIGDKELEAKKVAVRKRPETDLGSMDVSDFLTMARKEIVDKI